MCAYNVHLIWLFQGLDRMKNLNATKLWKNNLKFGFEHKGIFPMTCDVSFNILEFDLQSVMFFFWTAVLPPINSDCLVITKTNFIKRRWWWTTIRRGVCYMCRTRCVLTTTNELNESNPNRQEEKIWILDRMKLSRSSTCGHIVDCVTHIFLVCI